MEVDFKNLVQQMRQAQKDFFATHTKTALRLAKVLESQVDRILADEKKIEPEQPELFVK